MQQQKRATISIFQGSMVAWCWLQNCTEVSKFTEHLELHTASRFIHHSCSRIRSAFRTVFSLHLLSLFCSHEQDYNASIWLSLGSKAPSYFCTIFLVSPISCTCGQLWCVCLVSSSWMQQRFSLFKYVLTEMSQKSFVSNLKFSSVFSVTFAIHVMI